jgi:farnesol dehydrogenase
MLNCDYVFHLAAYAQVWARDSQTFHKINYLGTLNVINIASKVGVKKIVITSTAGVFGPSVGGIINEETKRRVDYFSLYERTKADAERLILERAERGLNVVIVNPTRVYGPGLLSTSNGVTRLIRLYIMGRFRFLPGNGKSTGNYVYIDDVVNGHLLALENGIAGEKYILGGENVSYIDFYNTLSEASEKKFSLIKFPVFLMLFVSYIMLIAAKWFGIKPLITPGLVKKYNYNWEVSSSKAQAELGYKITPLKTGFIKTIDFLISEKLLD